jgi:hypothetical protein
MSDPQAPQFSLEPLEPSPAKQVVDPWAAQTELATQFMTRGDEKSDLSTPVDQTIGKAVGDDQWELFVSCAPADALAQQFDIRLPTFMTLHSMGKVSSLSFLADVAAHLGVPVQKLVIRRQGFGTTLATLCFAEVPGANGQPIRVYASQAQAEPAAAHELTRLLLSRCKVSAVLLDGVSPGGWAAQVEALDAQLPAPLRPGSAMLLQPLLPTTELEPLRVSLSMRVGPSLRSMPEVGQPLQAWMALATVWNELLVASHPGTPSESLATFVAKQVSARPPISGSTTPPMSTPSQRAAPWRSACLALVERYGVQACCVFNARTLAILAHAGPAQPEPALMARQGRTLLAAMASSGQLLGLGKSVLEAQIILQDRVMLVWQMPVGALVDQSDVLWVMWMPLNLQGSWPAIKVALARSLTKA